MKKIWMVEKWEINYFDYGRMRVQGLFDSLDKAKRYVEENKPSNYIFDEFKCSRKNTLEYHNNVESKDDEDCCGRCRCYCKTPWFISEWEVK